MDYELMFPSLYIKAAELQGRDVTLTITKVAIESLKVRGGQAKDRGVIHFQKTDKGLVLNRTNADTIAKMHGRDTDKWIGKKITLYPTTTRFGPDTVPCVRVREKASAPPATSAGARTGGGDETRETATYHRWAKWQGVNQTDDISVAGQFAGWAMRVLGYDESAPFDTADMSDEDMDKLELVLTENEA